MKNFLILALICIIGSLDAQEHYTDINGQKFQIKTLGSGPITVLFECGMSDSLEVWGSIPDSVAQFASVFLYDRADIGKSDTSRQERTLPNMLSELHQILEKENIEPPYVLVGHSLGGLIDRYFASTYPGEVKGILLLEPAPEVYWDQMSKNELKKYITGGTEWYNSKFESKYRKEWFQFISNLEYMHHLNIPKGLPIILVSGTAWKLYDYHAKILAGFTNTQHFKLEGDHYIFKQHPNETIGYIRYLCK